MQFLNASKRPSMIIGGLAVIAHGFARATSDVDAAVVAELDDIPALFKLAASKKLVPRVDDAETFARESFVLLLRHAPSQTDVDISLAQQAFEHAAARNAETRKVTGLTLRVPSLTALFIYKLVASRTKDLDDVQALLRTKARFDVDAIRAQLAAFDALLETDRAGDFERLLLARR